VVIAILLGSILVPLTTQVAQRRTTDTQKRLEEVKEALLGFAVANRRLPCPASAASNGLESFCTNAAGACGAELVIPTNPIPAHGRCSQPYTGFVPAAALGLAATNVAAAKLGLAGADRPGYLIDAWDTPIRYALSTSNTNAFTVPNGMRSVGLTALAPDLWVCPTGTGITAADCGAGNPYLANSAVAVVYSLGPNSSVGGISADEAANPNPNSVNNDRVFVFHVRSDPGTASGEFDDIVTWLSANILYTRMVSAGQLP
jgi:type II secretory pathway pseudopilin PulG